MKEIHRALPVRRVRRVAAAVGVGGIEGEGVQVFLSHCEVTIYTKQADKLIEPVDFVDFRVNKTSSMGESIVENPISGGSRLREKRPPEVA